jgi:hypothetical protein
MARSLAKKDGKNAIRPTEQESNSESENSMVYLNTGISKGLFTRIVKYQQFAGFSSEQEAIRVGMNLYLRSQGF